MCHDKLCSAEDFGILCPLSFKALFDSSGWVKDSVMYSGVAALSGQIFNFSFEIRMKE